VTVPFLCITVPIFDPALEPAKLLIQDLQDQSCDDFICIFVSNGISPKTKKYITLLNNPRFSYDEIPHETIDVPNKTDKIVANLGKRIGYVLNKYDAERYIIFGADLKLLDRGYFHKLKENHHTADILLTQVKYKSIVLPKFPIKLSSIDIANYSFSKRVADLYEYPSDCQPKWVNGVWHKGYNDFRYYECISQWPNTVEYLKFVSAEKDGHHNNAYEQVSDI
jgi:hypothetical protein